MKSLAVKYRPQTLMEICAQESIIKILTKQIETNKINNCYLFCGASGCGKTTAARAFAKAINKGQGEPIEIDAASNNGVDNIRLMIEEAATRAIDAEYKIYIVDECHMLTTPAWNAALKLIEEPPHYTIFIFCTTDPQKIPATILNRVMRLNFNRIDSNTIYNRLCYISEQEQFTNYKDTCDYISRISKGQMRDAIASLEKCASYDSDLTINEALKALGDYSYDIYFKLINNLLDGNEKEIICVIESFYNNGNDLKIFIDQLFNFVMDVSKYILFKDFKMTSIPITYKEDLDKICNFDNPLNTYNYYMDRLLNFRSSLKNETEIKNVVEAFMMKLARFQ